MSNAWIKRIKFRNSALYYNFFGNEKWTEEERELCLKNQSNKKIKVKIGKDKFKIFTRNFKSFPNLKFLA